LSLGLAGRARCVGAVAQPRDTGMYSQYSLYSAVTIILARIHLHERLTKAGICGLCLAAASVSLIAAGSAA
jgi:drug/metabolite transporter (DMT)-like permease